MVGWFTAGGTVGLAPGPDDGARFNAGAVGASGTEAGGTGGGRSWNIWADAGSGTARTGTKTSTRANAIVRKGHPPCPNLTMPLSSEIMTMLFTENAANSSLWNMTSAGGCWRNPHTRLI